MPPYYSLLSWGHLRDLAVTSGNAIATDVTILAARAAQTYAEDGLPWEKDYATALTKAKGAHRPVFLMLTATCCFGQLA